MNVLLGETKYEMRYAMPGREESEETNREARTSRDSYEATGQGVRVKDKTRKATYNHVKPVPNSYLVHDTLPL
jgi:hypothetical protein